MDPDDQFKLTFKCFQLDAALVMERAAKTPGQKKFVKEQIRDLRLEIGRLEEQRLLQKENLTHG